MNPFRFYMDVHVPSAITKGLRLRGVNVLTAQEDGTRRDPDDSLLSRATELERIMFTHDADFTLIADDRQKRDVFFFGLVFKKKPLHDYGTTIEDLETIAKATWLKDLNNQILYLPLVK